MLYTTVVRFSEKTSNSTLLNVHSVLAILPNISLPFGYNKRWQINPCPVIVSCTDGCTWGQTLEPALGCFWATLKQTFLGWGEWDSPLQSYHEAKRYWNWCFRHVFGMWGKVASVAPTPFCYQLFYKFIYSSLSLSLSLSLPLSVPLCLPLSSSLPPIPLPPLSPSLFCHR